MHRLRRDGLPVADYIGVDCSDRVSTRYDATFAEHSYSDDRDWDVFGNYSESILHARRHQSRG